MSKLIVGLLLLTLLYFILIRNVRAIVEDDMESIPFGERSPEDGNLVDY
ncbi:MAG: hypothetical protein AAF824_20740 [Bacteroidota bacterium]